MHKVFCSFVVAALICSSIFAKEPVAQKQEETAVIIGSGIGALTSAIYLSRAGVKTYVIEGKNPGGALAQSPSVQNWPGEFDISGGELIEKIHTQAERNGVIFVQDEVTSVELKRSPFTITTRSTVDPQKENSFIASSCIIATGSEPSRLGVEGEESFWLKGVYSCAVCDGALFKGKTVAVVGGGDAALVEAQYLSQLADRVYILVRKQSLKANEKKRIEALKAHKNVEFVFGAEVDKILGSDKGLTSVLIRQAGQKKDLKIDGLFLAIGAKPSSELFKGQLALDQNGYIKVAADGSTTIPGVYAIGDVVDPIYKQAVSAAGAAAKAALSCQQYLFSAKATGLQASVSLQEAQPLPSTVIEIKNMDHFNAEVVASNVPVVVDFYASWCGPCRHIAPILESYAKQLQGKVKILKVNVNSCSDLADAYQIRAMPTLIALDSTGKIHERRTGAPEIIQYLKSIQ